MKTTTTKTILGHSLILLLSLVALTPDAGAAEGTLVGGNIANQTWTKDKSPYLVTNDVYVSGNLNIKDGVEVRFLSNWVFEVGGKLKVLGAAEAPVVFQPTDTNVGWQGLLFRDAVPGSFFVHAVIQGSINSGVRITNTPPAFTNCVIRNNKSPGHGGGILAQVSGSPLTLQSCVISSNVAGPYNSGNIWGGGICVLGSSILTDCLVADNRTQGSTGYGGGIFARGNCTLRNSRVVKNIPGGTSQQWADGIYFDNDGPFAPGMLEMNNCVVSGNGVPGAAGGGRIMGW